MAAIIEVRCRCSDLISGAANRALGFYVSNRRELERRRRVHLPLKCRR